MMSMMLIGKMERLLLLLLMLFLTGYGQVLQGDNSTEDDWLNDTLFVEEKDNVTVSTNGFKLRSVFSEENGNFFPVDPLKRVAFVALLLHILIVAAGIIIYSVTCCKSRAKKRRVRLQERRLQSEPTTVQHIPNTQNCPCQGCRVARQILSGLIVQHILTDRSEQ